MNEALTAVFLCQPGTIVLDRVSNTGQVPRELSMRARRNLERTEPSPRKDRKFLSKKKKKKSVCVWGGGGGGGLLSFRRVDSFCRFRRRPQGSRGLDESEVISEPLSGGGLSVRTDL